MEAESEEKRQQAVCYRDGEEDLLEKQRLQHVVFYRARDKRLWGIYS